MTVKRLGEMSEFSTTVKRWTRLKSSSRNRLFRPIRPAGEIDNVTPLLGMKKRHEETKDATNGRSGTVWGR